MFRAENCFNFEVQWSGKSISCYEECGDHEMRN